MKKPILILTTYQDPHVDAVYQHIKQKNQQTIIFYSNYYSSKQYIHYSSSSRDPYLIYYNGEKYHIADFQTIWYRKPNFWLDYDIKYASDSEKMLSIKYKRKEILSMYVDGIMMEAAKKDAFLVSSYQSIIEATNKLKQLLIAKEIGFAIPKTLVSTSIKELINFINSCSDEAIIKSISASEVRYGKYFRSFFTMPISSMQLMKHHKSNPIDYPLLLQEKIIKRLELRITVIGKHVFATALDSQSTKNGKTDWRKELIDNLPHSLYNLPKKIEKLCLNLCRHYGLQFGAIDMAVTLEGKYVFFELNPNGQYLWLELKTGQTLSKTKAELLVNPEGNKLR